MHEVTIFYWAGARAVAGTASETVLATSVAEALRLATAARSDGSFPQVIRACSVLVDSLTTGPDDLEQLLDGPVRVDVLPPFAGGADVRLRV